MTPKGIISFQSKSEVTDNNNLPSPNNHPNNGLSPILTILGVLWIVLPDLVPGPIDDLFVLLFLAFSNPGIGAFLSNFIRTILAMGALLWVAMPDVVPGPVDDFLLIILIPFSSSQTKQALRRCYAAALYH